MTREYVRVRVQNKPPDVYSVWHLTTPNGESLLCTHLCGIKEAGLDVAVVQAFDLFPDPMCHTCKARVKELDY